MSRLRIIGGVLVSLMLFDNIGFAQNVRLYAAIDGVGRHLDFEVGQVPEMGKGWNDVVSSVWVKDGYQFEGYEAINHQGAKFWIVAPANGQKPQLSHEAFSQTRMDGGWLINIHKEGWNDVLSSYKVQRSP